LSQGGILNYVASTPSIPTSFSTDAGTAIPVANLLQILGGEGIDTSAAGNIITITGELATAAANIGLANLGLCAFDSADFTVVGGFVQIAATFGGVQSILTDSGLPAVLPDGTGLVTFIGGNNITTTGGINTVTFDVTGTTNHAVQVGNATGSLTSLAVGVTGSVFLGNTGADPSFSAAMTNGQLIIGSTGNLPVLATITAGAGIGITNAAGAITISQTSGNLTWSNINSSGNLVVNTGVNCTGGAALSLALPATSAVGDVIRIVLDGSTSWTITQAANQQIRVGAVTTTLGVGGSINSIAQGDFIEMVCKTANLVWTAIGFTGLNVV
jgi:hypothetical protein